jgi:ABC-type multidrug transport system fused ATPase/permease subunit
MALGEIMKGRTSLVIAHRLGTIRNSDTNHGLDTGRLVEIGTHSELVEKEGVPNKAVERQPEISVTPSSPSMNFESEQSKIVKI